MARKRHTAEEIVTKLRQVDVLMAQGRPVAEAVARLMPTDTIGAVSSVTDQATQTDIVLKADNVDG